MALADSSPQLQNGSNWVVEHTTEVPDLLIPEGATVKASTGHSLTMTVNGIGTALRPGHYTGAVVLTVTDDVLVKFHDLPPHHFRSAVYIDNGKYLEDKSVSAAVVGGHVDDHRAENISVTSTDEHFNGVVVTGSSHYTISHPRILLDGIGGNDFAGFGAAIMSSGEAQVTVQDARITTVGPVRPAIFVGGHSTMTVNNSSIETFSGALPPDYKFTIEVGKMWEVPWMLGLSGNSRATNLVDHGTVYYNNSHIRAHGWGALSTDDANVVRMYAKNTLIETVGSGYGAYSIGDSIDSFSHCRFNVADIGLIMAAEGSGLFTDGTVVESGRFGVMMHSGGGGGLLTINKGSVFHTKSTAIQVKGRGTHIVVDRAQIKADNGILLQAMLNDDPFAAGMGPGGPGTGPGGPGAPPPPPVGVQSSRETVATRGVAFDISTSVTAAFRHVALRGDIINSRTSQGDMIVTLDAAQLRGAISTATAVAASGQAPNAATYRAIGDVINTLGATNDAHGLQVKLLNHSQWTVTKTSYLTELTLAPGTHLHTEKGERLTLLVDGVATPAHAGHFSGHVELRVAAM